MNRNLFSLQGYFKAGKRNAATGRPGALHWVGNVPEATLELSVETSEKRESFSGNRGIYKRMRTRRGGTFSGSMDEWSLKNLAMLLHSTEVPVVTGSVTGEVFPAGLVAGDEVLLAHPYASSLVITDSTGAPVTVSTDDYALEGHNDRTVRIIDPSTYTQPLKGAYSYAAYSKLDVFSQEPEETFIYFDGIDTEFNEPVMIEMFRVEFDPMGGWGLINEEFGNLPFSSQLLFDPLNVDSNGKGGYARFLSKTPV